MLLVLTSGHYRRWCHIEMVSVVNIRQHVTYSESFEEYPEFKMLIAALREADRWILSELTFQRIQFHTGMVR